jgi:hypothetical protein
MVMGNIGINNYKKKSGKLTTILIAMPPGKYGAMHIAQWSTSVASWEATSCCHWANAQVVLPWQPPWSTILNETQKH